ncbi:zinc ABC transporter substrate-binding protein [uncultured Jannaschia sp.]|uniref:zinc ABC transporter substrate-binding protein n=1 Tax=uncultured Jannaschia sp. TaxID=293347 RepID=UPI0026040304|nr:zinc ABC transporter substrate-binding protein [uncultured Jannaschia sp.]
MFLRSLFLLMLLSMPAAAQVPRVAADIGPVHSLVARVMDGVDVPALILPPAASPHGHALRPSEARTIENAEVVFWIGPDLEPWLDDAIGALAPDAHSVALVPAAADHEEAGDHDDHEEQDDHEGQGGRDDDHDHARLHAWLDPQVGKAWLDTIRETLVALDPENAVIYEANAEAGRAELDKLTARIEEIVAPVRGRGFVVFHDAYGAFEERFRIAARGAIQPSEASPPSAAGVAALRERVLADDVVCVFSEPQYSAGLVRTLIEGTEARTAVLDPLGTLIPTGKGLYPALLDNLARTMASCLLEG